MSKIKTQAPRRSLILAGGGLKVAFQAGVMQVWLDEAGIEFDHADGASGGVFNLAMYCQGMSGTEIAENWRALPILQGISLNWPQYFKLFFASSLLSYKRWRKNILNKTWNLNWLDIRQSDREATFNLYNFSKHRLETWRACDMDENALISCVSLPMWFPPVRIAGDDYIDAVYHTDANLLEAVNRGADELWIIWTVSERPLWRNGFIHNYFQIIEAAGNGKFRADMARINASNDAIRAGDQGEFGRIIEIKLLKAEVPLHYLLNFRSSRFTRAVDLGVDTARQWCKQSGIEYVPQRNFAGNPVYLEFTETMKGFVTMDQTNPVTGALSVDRTALDVRLKISTEDLDKFLLNAEHQGSATGFINCDALGGKRPVENGVFNLFVDTDRADTKEMRYQLAFTDDTGKEMSLVGVKRIRNDFGFDAWTDTTILYTRIIEGHDLNPMEEHTRTVASGIIRVGVIAFARQMLTFGSSGGSFSGRLMAKWRFLGFFIKSLWQTHGKTPNY